MDNIPNELVHTSLTPEEGREIRRGYDFIMMARAMAQKHDKEFGCPIPKDRPHRLHPNEPSLEELYEQGFLNPSKRKSPSP